MVYQPSSEEEARFLIDYDQLRFPNPMVTVDVIITRGSGLDMEVVLVKRGNYPYKGYWALPGGFVDPYETLSSAAMREVKEEAGLELDKISFFTIQDKPDRDPRGRAISMVYKAEAEGEPFAGDDAVEARWFSMADVQLLNIAFDHNEIVAQAWIYEISDVRD